MRETTVETIEVEERYKAFRDESGGYYPLGSMRFINSRLGWAVGSGQILKTINGGRTWTSHYTRRFSSESIGPEIPSPVDASQCWLLGHTGKSPMRCLLTRD